MTLCPHCRCLIPKRKVWTLTNLNSLTCPGCGSILRAAPFVNSLIGGLGAGAAVAVVGWGIMTGWSVPSLIGIALLPAILLYASSKFTTLLIDTRGRE